MDTTSRRRVLISGGAGFVGRNLVYALLRETPAPEITIVDDLSAGRRPDAWELFPAEQTKDLGWAQQYVIPKFSTTPFTFIKEDFVAILASELKRVPPLPIPPLPEFDEVYHLASIVGGRRTIEEQPLLVGADLAIDSLFFLWAATSKKALRILYPSSSAAYPTSHQQAGQYSNLNEDLIDFSCGVLAPDLTYGWSKLTGEYLAQIAVAKYGLKIGIVRPFSGYGEDQDLTYPVPAIALRVASHQNPVRVWGDGLQGRDFVHIDDCIRGLVLSCRQISDATAVNLGCGVLTSFLDLAKLMVDIEGYDAVVTGTGTGPVGVFNRVCRTERANSLLQWKPQVSLRDGMKRVIDHAKNRLSAGCTPDL